MKQLKCKIYIYSFLIFQNNTSFNMVQKKIFIIIVGTGKYIYEAHCALLYFVYYLDFIDYPFFYVETLFTVYLSRVCED